MSVFNFSQPFDPNVLFLHHFYALPNNWQAYSQDQAASAIPFPSSQNYFTGFPSVLVGVTNGAIAAQQGEGVCGGLVSAPVITPWSTNWIIGPAINWGTYTALTYPFWSYWGSEDTNQPLANYVEALFDWVNDPGVTNVVRYPAVTLVPGWQNLKQSPGGISRAIWIQGTGSSPPPPPATYNLSLTSTPLRPESLSVKVTASDGSTPTGSVAFAISSGGTVVSSTSASLQSGVASIVIALPVGSYTWTATFNTITSPPVTLAVN